MNEESPKQSSEKKVPGHKKHNGCWLAAGIGCIVVAVFTVLFMALFIALLAFAATETGSVSEEVLYEGDGGKIAVVRIEGVIAEGSSESDLLSVGGATADVIISELATALEDDSVDGVLLRMNTPGGEVVASDLIYRKVKEVSEEKPVVTWMSGTGASGGYMIAVGSDKIVAHPNTITGSIGVILQITNLEGLYEKLGIDSRVFKSGEFKDDEGVFDENPDGEADAIMQGLVDESYEDFIAVIAEGREMEVAEVRTLADGRVYTGTQAKKNGLADELGTMEDAIDTLETLIGKTGLSVVEYSTGGVWEGFYEYQRMLLNKVGFLPVNDGIGVYQYYLLDI